MTRKDLPDLRKLAANGQITYTIHCHQRMLSRGYLTADVERILASSTNQLIGTQPPSSTPGRKHKDPRYIISDPNYSPDTAVVITLTFPPNALPEINVITVEHADDSVWAKNKGNDPWLTRIGTMP